MPYGVSHLARATLICLGAFVLLVLSIAFFGSGRDGHPSVSQPMNAVSTLSENEGARLVPLSNIAKPAQAVKDAP